MDGTTNLRGTAASTNWGPSSRDALPFERFESLASRLLRVSKDEVREAEAHQQEKRRTA